MDDVGVDEMNHGVTIRMCGRGVKNANGLTDVCVIAKTKGVLGLNWIEFQE